MDYKHIIDEQFYCVLKNDVNLNLLLRNWYRNNDLLNSNFNSINREGFLTELP